MLKKYPPPKKTSDPKYMFGALKAAQAQYKNGRNRLTRQQPTTKLPTSKEELDKMLKVKNERQSD